MILESKTLETFGYEFKSLSKNSHKRVCIKCDYCGKEYDSVLKNRTLGYKKLPKDACNDCRYIKREEIGNNPFSRPEVKEKIRQKNIEKYGVEWHTQSESFKEKSKQTCLEKYGEETYSKTDESKQRYKETCLEKYGVENIMQLDETKEKARKSTLDKFGSESFFTSEECKKRLFDKFGVDNVFKLEEIKQQIVKSNIDKYGVEHRMKVEEIAKEVGQKSLQTKIDNGYIKTVDGKTLAQLSLDSVASKTHFYKLYKDFGLDVALAYERRKTDIEWAIDRILTRNNIQFEEKVKVGKYIPDFVCGNVIIEADGLYYHSEKFADRYYHFNKREGYVKLGYKPLFFTSDEIQQKPLIIESIIKNKLGLSERIYGRKTTFQKISKQEGKEFLNENHLMGNGAGECYSLSYNNTIFSVIQIKPTKDNVIEISRFCIKNGYSIIGGFSKLLKHLNLNRIKTFVDLRYGNGEHLKNLGFTENKAYPSFSWTDGYSKFHRMKFRKNTGYDNNLVKIWDCGQKCFVNY